MPTNRRRERIAIGFVGAGVVGSALALRLRQAGYRVTAVASRTVASAQKLTAQVEGCAAVESPQQVADRADLVFLTVPDDAILDVADGVEWRTLQMVVHCSGAKSLGVLRGPQHLGAQVGAFHPLQTFSSVQAALENLPGSTVAVEAGEPLLGILRGIATDLGAESVDLPAEGRVLYHLSGVLACNYMVTLLGLAAGLWEEFGLTREQGLKALLPLTRGTLHNIETVGIPQALTGPIARGDAGTIEAHIKELEARRPDLLAVYREMALRTLPLAEEKGRLSAEAAQRIHTMLTERIAEERHA